MSSIRVGLFLAAFCGLYYLEYKVNKQAAQIKELQECIIELREEDNNLHKADTINDQQVQFFLNGGWK